MGFSPSVRWGLAPTAQVKQSIDLCLMGKQSLVVEATHASPTSASIDENRFSFGTYTNTDGL